MFLDSLYISVVFSRQSTSKKPGEEDLSIIKALAEIHGKAEEIKNVSPISFFTFIRTYIQMNKMKKSILENRRLQLEVCIYGHTRHFISILSPFV